MFTWNEYHRMLMNGEVETIEECVSWCLLTRKTKHWSGMYNPASDTVY